MKENITGFVLAGGKSTRMGRDKGLIVLNNKRMVEFAIQALKPICRSIIILSNQEEYKALGYPVYPDTIKNKGPLAGICTGLSITETSWNVFTCCDSPFVTPTLFSFLLNESKGYEAVVPWYDGKVYPLTAAYHASCLKPFEKQVQNEKLKVKEAIQISTHQSSYNIY